MPVDVLMRGSFAYPAVSKWMAEGYLSNRSDDGTNELEDQGDFLKGCSLVLLIIGDHLTSFENSQGICPQRVKSPHMRTSTLAIDDYSFNVNISRMLQLMVNRILKIDPVSGKIGRSTNRSLSGSQDVMGMRTMMTESINTQPVIIIRNFDRSPFGDRKRFYFNSSTTRRTI